MALSKHALFVAAITAATGGPLLLSQGQNKTAPDTESRSLDAADPMGGRLASGARASTDPAGGQATDREPRRTVYSSAPLEGYPVGDLGELFRFDVTPAFIMQRFGRVYTATPEADLRGYRVSVVTGTAEFDLAGSLTYYFDREQKVAMICFIGATGDPRPLVNLVTRKYELSSETTDDPGRHVYRKRQGRSNPSELIVKPGEVIRADQPRSRYAVELTLARPPETSHGRGGPLSPGVRRAWEPTF